MTRTVGEEFAIPVPIDDFAPDKSGGGGKMDFFIRYKGYMQTYPDSVLDTVLRGQMTFDQLLVQLLKTAGH